MSKPDDITKREQRDGGNWKENFIKHSDIAILAFCVVAACLLFYFVLFRFEVVKKGIGVIISVISPVIVGFIFAYILNPIVMMLEKKFMKIYEKRQAKKTEKEKNGKVKNKQSKKVEASVPECDDIAECTNQNPVLTGGRKGARRVAIFVTMVVTITAVGLLAMSVIPALGRSITSLAEKLPGYYNKVSEVITDFVNEHEWISKQIPDVDQILENLNVFEILSNYINSVLLVAYDGVVIIFKIIYNVLVGLIISVYLLGGKERYIGQMKKVVFAVMKPERAKVFIQNMHKSNNIFKSAILGKILDSIIIGCLCFIGMSIFGILGFDAIGNNRVLLSVVVGVTNVIQFFGPYIGGIPSVFLVFCENPVEGLIFGIFIIVLQQFDCNYLDPKIVGNSVGLSPIYVLIFCILGGGFFGLPGMLVATPTGAIIYGIVKTWMESKLENKNLPVSTAEYAENPGAVIYKNYQE